LRLQLNGLSADTSVA